LGVQEDPEPWFKEKADEVLSREIILTQMLQTVQRLILRYQELGKCFASHIENVRIFIEGMEDAHMKSVLESSCQGLEQTKDLIDDIVCELSVTVNGNLLDYIHELQSINSLIERRIPLLRAYLSASKDAASGTPEATAKSDEAQTQLAQFSNAARADIQQVCDIRTGDMERFFIAISRFSQEYYRLLTARWDAVLGNEPAGPGPAATASAIASSDGAFGVPMMQSTESSPYADAY